MSFVVTVPELVEAAAQDLSGIRSALGEATAAAAAPTTGIAAAGADEVSTAIATLFAGYGQEFHALSAQAAAFHQEFVNLLNGGANAYLETEAANAEQTLLNSLSAPAQSLSGQIKADVQGFSNSISGAPAAALGALETGQAPALIQELNSFGATVAGPYEMLFSNTSANLQAIGSTFTANPFPVLHQIVNNQIGYAQTIGSSIATGIQNLPSELANLPATIWTGIQGLATFNPWALLQQFVNNQIGYAQTIITGLQHAGNDLVTGLAGLPASFQAAGQALAAGNVQGAVNALGQGVQNIFLPGFQEITVPFSDLGNPAIVVPITPLGPLGDLAPILAIPGQMAQNFTNLLPPGSIPAQISQNFTNLLSTVTNFGTTLNLGTLGINFGLPLQLVFDGTGAPVNALIALNSSAQAFVTAVQTGNASAAAAAILDAPAVVANGFLNGQTHLALPPVTLNLTSSFGDISLTTTAELPLGGLLTPLSPVVLAVGGPVPGTPIGGLIPGLLSFGSELAGAITP
jgi:hypothetical protein